MLALAGGGTIVDPGSWSDPWCWRRGDGDLSGTFGECPLRATVERVVFGLDLVTHPDTRLCFCLVGVTEGEAVAVETEPTCKAAVRVLFRFTGVFPEIGAVFKGVFSLLFRFAGVTDSSAMGEFSDGSARWYSDNAPSQV